MVEWLLLVIGILFWCFINACEKYGFRKSISTLITILITIFFIIWLWKSDFFQLLYSYLLPIWILFAILWYAYILFFAIKKYVFKSNDKKFKKIQYFLKPGLLGRPWQSPNFLDYLLSPITIGMSFIYGSIVLIVFAVFQCINKIISETE